ncbi:hypothetical protein BC827DRAFT_953175 [Russula dissimulans]|nr:hypothetical protein BC827DRAFT_953175 [Russula dissimulans]
MLSSGCRVAELLHVKRCPQEVQSILPLRSRIRACDPPSRLGARRLRPCADSASHQSAGFGRRWEERSPVLVQAHPGPMITQCPSVIASCQAGIESLLQIHTILASPLLHAFTGWYCIEFESSRARPRARDPKCGLWLLYDSTGCSRCCGPFQLVHVAAAATKRTPKRAQKVMQTPGAPRIG